MTSSSSMSDNNHARKQLEERNLRLLRELASLPHNKQCFDCYQRGPTYVDMTIGSFVCTKCSGLLRGLNPPHRVKSISMATFTPPEIEFLKNAGNEYCKKVWTGRYGGGNRDLFSDGFVAKDESQMKDLLIMKYEKKLWYVSPEEANNKTKKKEKNGIIPTGNISRELSPPAAGSSSPLTVLSKSPYLFLTQGDLMAAKTSSTSQQQPQQTTITSRSCRSPASANALFDPFDDIDWDFPIITNSNNPQQHQQQCLPKSATMPAGILQLQNNNGVGGNETSREVQPPEMEPDKYAALAELDELFHTTKTDDRSSTSSSATTNLNRSLEGAKMVFTQPPTFTQYYAPTFAYTTTPYSSFGIAAAANPFPNPGTLRHQPQQQQWAYPSAGSGFGPMMYNRHEQNNGGGGGGFPFTAQYAAAQSIVNTGMNPFMAPAVYHQTPSTTTARNPFL